MRVKTEEYLPSYRVMMPERQITPVVFDSPHSGRDCPADFNFICGRADIERSVDHFVDELFDFAPAWGMPLLSACFYRSYIDLNRAANEIDPAMLSGTWPEAPDQSSHVKSGAGLIRKFCLSEDSKVLPIYDAPLPVEDILNRIQQYYIPYHDGLEKLLDQTADRFGAVWHINCHSMPSQIHGPSSRLPDFVLGDYSGTSCMPAFTRYVRQILEDMNYSVSINKPYKGVEIIRRYSAPAMGRHSLQLEINRDLYMDEKNFKKLPQRFAKLRADLQSLVRAISSYAESQISSRAAE